MPPASPHNDRSNPRLVSLSRAGYRALEKGRLEDAQRYFNQMLAVDPRNRYAQVGLAELCRKRRDLPGALRRYLECLSGDPGNRYALKGAAECSYELGDFRRSAQMWRAYGEAVGVDAVTLTHLADAHRKLGEAAEAEAAYRNALRLDPHNRYSLNGMAHLLFDSERFEEAAETWDRLAALDPGNVRVLVGLGNCHRKLKDFQKAMDCFQAAADLERDNFFVLYGIADSYRGLGNHEKALRTWQRILEASPNNRIILTRAGDSCRSLGELASARSYYRQALACGDDEYAEIGLALVDMVDGDFSAAIGRLTVICDRDPANARASRALADCLRAAADEGAEEAEDPGDPRNSAGTC